MGLSGSMMNNDNNITRAEAQQDNNVIRVAAGGGNSTAPLTVFVPQSRDPSRTDYNLG